MNKILSRRLLLILTLLATIFFSFVTFELNVLPLKYYIPMVVILLLFALLLYFIEKDKNDNHPIKVAFFKLVNIILAVALVLVHFQFKRLRFFSEYYKWRRQSVEIDVAVLKSSSYDKLASLKGKSFGANTSMGALDINKSETIIEDEIGDIKVTSYKTNNEVINALKNHEIEAMIVKEVELDSLNDIEKDFTDQIRIIKKIQIKKPRINANSAKVTKEPFHILISGLISQDLLIHLHYLMLI